MKIERKSFNNENKTFTFDVSVFEFLVKNLTDEDILVCFGTSFVEADSILIPSYSSQIIVENIRQDTADFMHDSVTVKATGEGEVEVQCLEY